MGTPMLRIKPHILLIIFNLTIAMYQGIRPAPNNIQNSRVQRTMFLPLKTLWVLEMGYATNTHTTKVTGVPIITR